MAPAKRPAEQPAKVSTDAPSAWRLAAAALPLGIALAHGALTGPGTPPVQAPLATVQAVPGAAGAPSAAGQVAAGQVAAVPESGTENLLTGLRCGGDGVGATPCAAPYPMLTKGHPVDWWFVFKLNSGLFAKCGAGDTRSCPFGGKVQTTPNYAHFGQQYVVASSETPAVTQGSKDCAGTTTDDPLGATFDEVYHGSFHYVVWNDQSYGAPNLQRCGQGCGAPWGHSKGLLAWNDVGQGMVMQVSTPSWPLSGSALHPRDAAGAANPAGNTLGCVSTENDVEVSQHFFALRLTKADLVTVLLAMGNASVVTDKSFPQVVSNGGPADVQQLVASLGATSKSTTATSAPLSTRVQVISKPSLLHVPPWQLVSSLLGGVSLRAATWWDSAERIYSTTADYDVTCWNDSLAKPGGVEIATSGAWQGVKFALVGGDMPNANHAKVGVSTSGTAHYAIFGDMNQEGSRAASETDCARSQNGRGGMFFVINDAGLAGSVGALIAGDSAPLSAPGK